MASAARRARSSTPAIVRQADRRLVPQADAPAPGAQPGHVRGLRGLHPHHAAVGPGRRRARARRRPGSSSGCRCGSGSPCSSPTSPRRWPRGAARPRRRRCAEARRDLQAKRLDRARSACARLRVRLGRQRSARATCVLVEAGDFIPADGTVVEGVASVNESRHHRRERAGDPRGGGDRSSVTGGTQVLSDWLIVEVTANPGEALPRPHDRARWRAPSARRRPTRSRSTSCSPR